MLKLFVRSLLIALLPAALAAQNSISIDQIVLQYPEDIPADAGGEYSGLTLTLTPGGENRFPPVFVPIEASVTISYNYDLDNLDHLSPIIRGTIDPDGPIYSSCNFSSDVPGNSGGVSNGSRELPPEIPKPGERQGGTGGHVLPPGALFVSDRDLPAQVDFTCTLRARGGLSFPTARIAESDPIVGFVSRDFNPGTVSEVDVLPSYIEVTQAIQDDNNNVRLVAGKTTLARVFIRPGDLGAPTPNRVEAVLYAFPAGSDDPLPGSPLLPDPLSVGTAPALEDHNREIVAHSVNFTLPKDWTRADRNIVLVADVDPEGKIANERRDNNFGGEEEVKFFERDVLGIGYLPLCVETTAGAGFRCPKTERIVNVEGLTNQLFPLADGDVVYFPIPMPDLQWKGELETSEQRAPLRQKLRKLYDFMDLFSAGQLDQVAVWVDSLVSIGRFAGGSKIGGFAGAKWADSDALGRMTFMRASGLGLPALLAHEVGHNLGLRHPDLGARSCSSEDPDSDWPHENDRIQDVGYDSRRRSLPLLRSREYADLMSYCRPKWISPFHYSKLFDADSSPQGLTEEKGQGVPTAYWIVSGSVGADGSGAQLDPAYRTTSRTPADATGQGEYCVQLSGGSTATHCLNLSFREPETGAALERELFSVRVPDPGGVTKIALLRNGAEIASIAQSASAPSLEITSPAPGAVWEGEQAVAWTATDGDGDPLTYAVLYSPDAGESWLPIDVDTQDAQCMVDTSRIDGGEGVTFRVLASDGVNTTEADVGPITVIQRPEIAASPAAPNVGGALVGSTRDVAVTLTNPGTGPLTVDSVASDSAVFEVVGPATPFQIPAGSERVLRLRFSPPSAGAHVASLAIGSDSATQPTFNLAVEGTGVAAESPLLELAQNAVEFGDVAVGAVESQPFALANPGGAPLNVQLAVQGAGFGLSGPAQAQIAPGGMLELMLSFSPSSAGDVEGVLVVASDDPIRPRAEASLSGTGFVAVGAPGPTPNLAAGGIVDAAQFGAVLTPGAIGSLFGTELADTGAGATSAPLPTTLAGARVLVDGIPAPLFFASPQQINFQAPFEIGFGEVPVVVQRNGVSSAQQTVSSRLYAPSVFGNPFTGLAIAQRPSGELVSAEAPAQPGEVLIFYVTGIGGLTDPPTTGAPSGASPLAISQVPPTMTLGGADGQVLFAGMAPGFIGLGQVNAFLPDPLPAASAVRPQQAGVPQQGVATLPLVFDFGGASNVPVELPVASDGPPAVDVSVRVTEVLPSMPSLVAPSDRLTVRYVASNAGGQTLEGTRRIYLSTDAVISPDTDTLLSERDLIVRGNASEIQSRGIRLPDGLQPGTYYIGVQAIIPGDVNPDNDVSNAVRIDAVGDRDPFDISLESFSVEPESAGPGDPVRIAYEVSGPSDLSATFTRTFYLSADPVITEDDISMGSNAFSVLEGGLSVSVSSAIPRSVEPGQYFIGMIVQTEGDTDPSDNALPGRAFTVLPDRAAYDLGVEARSVVPNSVSAGGSIDVTYRVTNHSQSSGIFLRRIYVSADETITTADTLVNERTFTLNGQGRTITSTNNETPALPPGDYFVGVLLETTADVNPDDNTSNARRLTITPGAALAVRPEGRSRLVSDDTSLPGNDARDAEAAADAPW